MDPTFAPQHLDALAALAWTWAVAFLPRLVMALLILVVGTLVARWASRIVTRAVAETAHVDETARPVLASAVRYSVLILALVAALSQIGVQTASLLAVLGAAGLAIGLALQGTLANIASGIMLLWLRPFRVGDYIEVVSGNPIAGIVREIGLFASQLETYDGIFVFAPNSAIWNSPLRNHTRTVSRLVSLTVALPSGADIDHARQLLLGIAREDRRILKHPPPDVFIDDLSETGIILRWRIWADRRSIGELQRSILEEAKQRLEAVEALKPQKISRTVPPDADPSRLMTSDAFHG